MRFYEYIHPSNSTVGDGDTRTNSSLFVGRVECVSFLAATLDPTFTTGLMSSRDSVGPDSMLSSEEDEARLLEDALTVTKAQGVQMKRCLDHSRIPDAFTHVTNFLSELRTSYLSPKKYYELYVAVLDQLRILEFSLIEEIGKGKTFAELYEQVQYCNAILPRLYMLITVGGVYMKTYLAKPKDVLVDLVEMCRGVQHPLRGLFLRSYLAQVTKNCLPDITSESDDGKLMDSIQFVLANFCEMNKLWVRLQHQGPSSNRAARDRERKELRLLVGTCLVRLSQLEGVTLEIYRTAILPELLEQVVSCHDAISQEYIMECIIQVFHDALHLETLPMLVGALFRLEQKVSLRNILISLMDRFATFFSGEPGKTTYAGFPLFDSLYSNIGDLLLAKPDIPSDEVLSICVSLMNLSLVLHPENLKNVESIMGRVHQIFVSSQRQRSFDKQEPAAGKQLMVLLKTPVQKFYDLLSVLALDPFVNLLQFLSFGSRNLVAIFVANTLLEKDARVRLPDQAERLMTVIQSLIRTEPDQEESEFDVIDDQITIARLVHLFKADTVDDQLRMLEVARTHFARGGPRIRYTFPALLSCYFQLAVAHSTSNEEEAESSDLARRALVIANHMISALNSDELFENALRLYVQAASVASACSLDSIAYEFFVSAFTVYEENISETKAQIASLTLIIGALQSSCIFSAESYDILSNKCVLHSARLLKKPDQCRSVLLSAHLFWVTAGSRDNVDETKLFKDEKRVLECLQRSLKIADSCMDLETKVALFIDILNEYLYYFEKENSLITVDYINGLLDLISTNLANLDSSPPKDILLRHFRSTLGSVRFKQMQAPSDSSVSYFGIDLAYLNR